MNAKAFAKHAEFPDWAGLVLGACSVVLVWFWPRGSRDERKGFRQARHEFTHLASLVLGACSLLGACLAFGQEVHAMNAKAFAKNAEFPDWAGLVLGACSVVLVWFWPRGSRDERKGFRQARHEFTHLASLVLGACSLLGACLAFGQEVHAMNAKAFAKNAEFPDWAGLVLGACSVVLVWFWPRGSRDERKGFRQARHEFTHLASLVLGACSLLGACLAFGQEVHAMNAKAFAKNAEFPDWAGLVLGAWCLVLVRWCLFDFSILRLPYTATS